MPNGRPIRMPGRLGPDSPPRGALSATPSMLRAPALAPASRPARIRETGTEHVPRAREPDTGTRRGAWDSGPQGTGTGRGTWMRMQGTTRGAGHGRGVRVSGGAWRWFGGVLSAVSPRVARMTATEIGSGVSDGAGGAAGATGG